jgi:DNA-binding response OmpR family regulator
MFDFAAIRGDLRASPRQFSAILPGLSLAVAPPMSTRKRVLIVEDDLNTLGGYLEFLTAAGFEPTGVDNGADALPIALRNPPAAVVTDINLPGMNGFELAAALRQNSSTRDIPVIGLTAHWSTDVHVRGREVAMQVILSKPCIPAHLVAELERVLGCAKTMEDVSSTRTNPVVLTPADLRHALLTFRAHGRLADG